MEVLSCSDMFKQEYVPIIQDAINNMTLNEQTGKVKSGFKICLKYLLSDLCRSMNDYLRIEVHFFRLHWEMKELWSRVNYTRPVSFHFPVQTTKNVLQSLYLC